MNNEVRADMLTAAMQSLHAAADILQDLGEETLSIKIRNEANNVAAKQRQAVKAASVPVQIGEPKPQ